MNYAKITYMDTANGTGLRTTLFVSGCRHHCKECFNQETWDFRYGKPFTDIEKHDILISLKNPHVKGITFLGGEPLEPENQPAIRKLIETIVHDHPDKDIWLYTGCTFEELAYDTCPYRTEHTDYILSHTDVLVDGPFIQNEIDLIGTPFRGSKNQRLIRCKECYQTGQLLLLDIN